MARARELAPNRPSNGGGSKSPSSISVLTTDRLHVQSSDDDTATPGGLPFSGDRCRETDSTAVKDSTSCLAAGSVNWFGRDAAARLTAPRAASSERLGRFGVVTENDLRDVRDDSSNSCRSLRHLEDEGLIRRSPLSSDDRAVVVTDRGRSLETNCVERPDRTDEPRQAFYAA